MLAGHGASGCECMRNSTLCKLRGVPQREPGAHTTECWATSTLVCAPPQSAGEPGHRRAHRC
eukprot:357233-Chlamydomonas_euryale.AAC.10